MTISSGKKLYWSQPPSTQATCAPSFVVTLIYDLDFRFSRQRERWLMLLLIYDMTTCVRSWVFLDLKLVSMNSVACLHLQ